MVRRAFVAIALAVACLIVLCWGCRWVQDPARKALKGLEAKAREGPLDPRDDPEVDQLVSDLATYWRYSLELVPAYIRKHSRDEGPKGDAAIFAVESLSRIRDRRAIPQLAKLAKDPRERISLPVVMSLRSICDERDLSRIIDLIQDEDFKWKTRMTELLGKFGSADSADFASCIILPYLKTSDQAIRRGAVLALKRLGDGRFIPDLVQTLSADPDPAVRVAAAEALGSLGDRRGIDYLLEQLDPSGQPESTIRACFAARRLKLDEAVPKLSELVREGDDFVRTFAEIALTGMGTERAAAAVRELSLPSDEPYILHAHERDKPNWL